MSEEKPSFAKAVIYAGAGAVRVALYAGATLGTAAIIGASTTAALGIGVPTVVGGIWVAKKLGFLQKK
jgi:hypothetical protein